MQQENKPPITLEELRQLHTTVSNLIEQAQDDLARKKLWLSFIDRRISKLEAGNPDFMTTSTPPPEPLTLSGVPVKVTAEKLATLRGRVKVSP